MVRVRLLFLPTESVQMPTFLLPLVPYHADIESKTNSVVRFPNPRDASDIVTIFGPGTRSISLPHQVLMVCQIQRWHCFSVQYVAFV